MSNVLVRGVSEKVHQRIQRLAEAQHSSVNQILLRLIEAALAKEESQKEKEEREKEAFRRIKELREEIYRKYGPQEDSTKLIREDRDSR